MAAIFTGISCKEAVFITTNRIIPRVGVLLDWDCVWAIAFMAARPQGRGSVSQALAGWRKGSWKFSPESPHHRRYSGKQAGNHWVRVPEPAAWLKAAFLGNFQRIPARRTCFPARNRDNSTADCAPSIRAVESSPSLPVARAHNNAEEQSCQNQIEFNILSPPFPRVALDFGSKKSLSLERTFPVWERIPTQERKLELMLFGEKILDYWDDIMKGPGHGCGNSFCGPAPGRENIPMATTAPVLLDTVVATGGKLWL